MQAAYHPRNGTIALGASNPIVPSAGHEITGRTMSLATTTNYVNSSIVPVDGGRIGR